MSGNEIFFKFPQAGLLILLLLPILYGLLRLSLYRKNMQKVYTSSKLLSLLMVPRSTSLTYTKLFGWALIWTLTCLSLMSPFGNTRYSSVPSSSTASGTLKTRDAPHEVIFLVDTSASMGVPDGPEGETRLEEAKVIMEDLIRLLRGQTVSLYAFTSELTPVVPPTLDYLFTRLSIKELHINEGDVGGTRLAPILKELKQQAFPEPSQKNYTIIMLTDGGDTRLEAAKGAERQKEKEAIITAIANPLQYHLRLFTIGLGSAKPAAVPHVDFEGKPVLSKLEPEILEGLAANERGRYYKAEEWTSWDLAKSILSQMKEEELIQQNKPQAPQRQFSAVDKEDVLVDLYYQIPLGLAILFYLINFILPDVRRI